MSAEVFAERVVDASPDTVRRVLEGPWLEELGTEAGEGAQLVDAQLRAQLGRARLKVSFRKAVKLEAGKPQKVDDRIVLPLTWESNGFEGVFPVMHAMVELRPAGRGQTALLFWGRYDPPLGRIGDIADRFIAHRVAEATVEHLLDAVVARCLRGAPKHAH